LASATAAPSPKPELQPVINVTDIAQSSFGDLSIAQRCSRGARDANLYDALQIGQAHFLLRMPALLRSAQTTLTLSGRRAAKPRG